MSFRPVCLAAALALMGTASFSQPQQTGASGPARPASVALRASPSLASSAIDTVPGMPPVIDANNLYSEIAAGKMSANVAGALERIYVPNRGSNSVTVIDPATMKVIETYKVGRNPQHVVPSWDLQTLWVANNAEGRSDGSLTPIDPKTGKAGRAIAVDDPYNLYWSPDGRYAIVVAEARKRLDFRDPKTMKLAYSIPTPECAGINHADFSIDGRYALFTCEFGGGITKIDLVNRKVMETIKLSKQFDNPEVMAKIAKAPQRQSGHGMNHGDMMEGVSSMPQDVRASPDGKIFYVADMAADGVHVVDLAAFRQIAFIPTGVGTHGLYPSRDGKQLYVANRGTNKVTGTNRGKGSVSVIDFATRKVVATWVVPGGGSPDMGNVSADGKYLWLSGRYDGEVYRFDTNNGSVERIKAGQEPHGLAVWPQPGRYSLGHTGNLR